MEDIVFCGVDLGGTRTKLGVVRSDGTVEEMRVIETERERGPRDWLARVTPILRAWRDERGVRAVGVGAPGPLDPKTGVLTNPVPNLAGWEGFPIVAEIEKAVGCPTFLDNDANVTVFAERFAGAAKGVDDFIVLTLGTGVGGGVMIGGRPLRGARGLAGEVGHLSVDQAGPKCVCGSNGCWEGYLGLPNVMKRARELAARDGDAVESPQALLAAIQREAPWTAPLLDEIADWLGVGIASLVHLFNPALIVLAGGLSAIGAPLVERAREAVARRILPEFADGLRIERSKLGDELGVLGAAFLALDELEASRREST